MREIFEWVFSVWKSYWGEGMYHYLFLMAILLLVVWGIVFRKKTEGAAFLYILLAAGIIFCPVTAKIISLCIGENVYWRVLWILPVLPVIAYGLTRLVLMGRVKILKVLLFLALSGGVAFCGKGMYTAGNYVTVANVQKVPDEVAILCDQVNQAKGEAVAKIAVEDFLAAYVRVYDASILMPYSRGANGAANKESRELYDLLTSGSNDYERIVEICKNQNCNFLVIRNAENSLLAMEELGCSQCGSIGIYELYRIQ